MHIIILYLRGCSIGPQGLECDPTLSFVDKLSLTGRVLNFLSVQEDFWDDGNQEIEPRYIKGYNERQCAVRKQNQESSDAHGPARRQALLQEDCPANVLCFDANG